MEERNNQPDVPVGSLTRRRFLGLVGSSAAAASVAACRTSAPEQIVPYAERPPEATPGKAQMYATGFLRDGYAVGILGASREGRPIKIEGNPRHPASLGGSGAWEQATTLSLYDSDRADQILRRGRSASWGMFSSSIAPDSERRFAGDEGRGLHLWLEPTSSPLVEALLARLRRRYPRMQVWFDPTRAPVNRWEGARRAFGRVVEPQYDFERAERVLALDADFLSGQPMSLRWAKRFTAGRYLAGPDDPMNRLYSVEPGLSVTGITADHHFPVQAREVLPVALGLLDALRTHRTVPEPLASRVRGWAERSPRAETMRSIARDLAAHAGRCVVVVGDRQPPAVHALGHALNAVLDAPGRTVHHVPSPILEAGERAFEPQGLLDALDAGEVDSLFTLESNPSYTAPGQWRFRERARKADVHVHAAPYRDETARDATWFIPTRHVLEQWGAARSQDGTVTPIQPLIRSLFGEHQVEQVLAALDDRPAESTRSLLRESWNEQQLGPLERALAAGLAEGSTATPEAFDADWEAVARAAEPPPSPGEGEDWELVFEPDPRIRDGRYANNAWLQELPEPATKLVWDNAAVMSEQSASELGVGPGDVVEIRQGDARARLPVWIEPMMTERAVLLWLGYGRPAAGSVGSDVGVDVGALRPADGWFVGGASVRPTGQRYELATTQRHRDMEGRPIVLRQTLEQFREHPETAGHDGPEPPTIYADRIPEQRVAQWGMTIDLNRCTGCSACVIACQAENNVPAVGKSMVAAGREMHWLRIDRYDTGTPGDEHADVQPMLCQHCEQAPCEYVCPVNATVHSPDGLNEMVYNRCVGTRFCSNNCPYKIRRFNWFEYHRDVSETRKMAMNPDVSVRARGVIEKCTYCVQRIRRAEIEARREGRHIHEMDVTSACAQACPTDAIVFGAVSDPDSRVSQMYDNPRTYGVLDEDLGTQPRTRYLMRVVNRNPELQET